MTRFQLHRADWNDCLRCELGEHRTHVCHLRGKLPADVLFVGEAPGQSENGLGSCFIGPAGQLLDRIVENGFRGRDLRVAFTNLVGCIPLRDERGKEGSPEPEHIKACQPRLQEIIDMANPRLIVRVGAMARTWLTPGYKGCPTIPEWCALVVLEHPAHLMRMPTAQSGLAVQRCVVTLRNAVEELK